jgi:hypothetical protein
MTKRLLLLALLLVPAVAFARKAADKSQTVDSGSYGIFVNGKRIATETFTIVQRSDFSTVRSEVTLVEANAAQKSELQVLPAGQLRRYQWNEVSPGRAQTVLEPDGEFLIERMIIRPGEKPTEQPYLLPATTIVLDDYFFTHRQVLAWRYLAAGCTSEGGQMRCKLPRTAYGAIVPRQHASLMVNIEHTGREKVKIRGAERELMRFNLQGEGMDWALWLDDNLKLIRVLIAAEHTEVLRD